jgi:outer membrane receptor protein involved in Fe transport
MIAIRDRDFRWAQAFPKHPGSKRGRQGPSHKRLSGRFLLRTSARILLLASTSFAFAAPGFAQAPETQSSTDPAPAENAANQEAAQVNDPGVGNSPATEAASGGVEEIVVTAQFREQNLQDTPIAITAVSGAMLEARSQTNISQVANQAPSVTLKPQGSQYGASLSANIRGVGQFDFNPALEPGVGLYVDDVYYATLTGSIFDLLDLERVEILRGPQGTLAGKNSIGGAVKLYSKRPTGDGSGYVHATYGSRNRIDLRAGIDFNILNGVDARIAGVAKKQDGYVKRLDFGCVYPAGGPATFVNSFGVTLPVNPARGIPAKTSDSNCVTAREGEVDYQAIRGQLRWRPSDTIDINIIGDYTHDDRTAAGTILLERDYPNGYPASPNFPPQTVSSGIPGPTGVPQNYSTAPPPRDINPYGPGLVYDRRSPSQAPFPRCRPLARAAAPSSTAGASPASSTGSWRTHSSSSRSAPIAPTNRPSPTTTTSRPWPIASASAISISGRSARSYA